MSQQNFTDQLSRQISVNFPPKRIISLVPSQTELLFDMGLGAEIIGITKFCKYPSGKIKSKTKIGGTKKLYLDKIRNLKPDLIIGNKEENEQVQIETLMQEFPVWISDISDLRGALEMITCIGELVNRKIESAVITQQMAQRFNALHKAAKTLKVAYLIWQKPYMVAGVDTFINDMLQRCGWQNIINTDRYPVVTIHDLNEADVIMLSSEPYPFKQKHADFISTLCPQSKVILVDGEMFSWYGSRLLKAADYFEQLITALNN
ncbi:MAG: helical backbone metal receptor [Mucilaginibacter sp.]|uniref:ABC transporter substrate-binding protein n=1 Tax=Mucilaginibacter sp. TaxID=1882438 RepID=UPI0032666BE1